MWSAIEEKEKKDIKKGGKRETEVMFTYIYFYQMECFADSFHQYMTRTGNMENFANSGQRNGINNQWNSKLSKWAAAYIITDNGGFSLETTK